MNEFLALVYSPWIELKRIALGTPHSAEVDVTDRCNLRCRHCYHFHGKKRFRRGEVPIGLWEIRLRRLYRAGIRFLLLVGGEPALRLDVLMLAHSMFPFVYVITNGTIPIPRAFDHRLFVSLDGTRRTNDEMRGAGVFDRVMRNYTGDDRVVVNMTVAANNFTELEEVVRTSIDNGFRGVVCNLFTPTVGETSLLRLSDPQRQRIVAELRRVKARYPDTLLLSPRMIDWYARADHGDRCYWGDRVLHFDADWNQRRCFADADCRNCGCLGGAFGSPRTMLRHPREMIALM